MKIANVPLHTVCPITALSFRHKSETQASLCFAQKMRFSFSLWWEKVCCLEELCLDECVWHVYFWAGAEVREADSVWCIEHAHCMLFKISLLWMMPCSGLWCTETSREGEIQLFVVCDGRGCSNCCSHAIYHCKWRDAGASKIDWEAETMACIKWRSSQGKYEWTSGKKRSKGL